MKSKPDRNPMTEKKKGFDRRRNDRNRRRLGGNGLSLQAFANAHTTYNPHLIKKQKEHYKNARLVKKFKKSVQQQEKSENHLPSIPVPETEDATRDSSKKKMEAKKKKNSLQGAREEYERKLEEEEKVRAERQAMMREREERRARAEGQRKALKENMYKKTRSGQPVMKYRIEHLLEEIQNS